jgi:formyl-CoA transferase
MESLIPDHLAYGVNRQRVGGRMEGIAPSNSYACADGQNVVIAANGDGIFRRFMATIGRDDLAASEELSTNAQRWAHRDELDEAIRAWTAGLPRAVVLTALDTAGVPAGPIYTAADICADEQYRKRGMIQYFEVDTGDSVPARVGFPGIVPVLDGTSLPVRSVGPDLGEHTTEVLHGLLGLSPDKIAAATGTELP